MTSPRRSPKPTAEARPGFKDRWVRRLVRLLPRTTRGILGLVGGVLLLGVLGTLGGVHLVEYSESAAFCTTCHTMNPQKKAYEAGVHQDVGCGECHVNPGVVGFVKAKLAGTRELYALVTSTYPTPIPPIPHDELPPTKNTCEKCHPLSQLADPGQPSKLHVRASFERDEPNTRHDLAVLIRPANADSGDPVSVHWHVLQDVTYTSSDEHQQTIDSVQFKDSTTGELEQYIAEGQVRESINAGADLARLTATETTRTMDCLACHNRVGHDSPTADRAVDAALADGSISSDLPFVKRNAVALLTTKYATDAEGRAAISKLSDFYATKYPLVAKQQASEIAAATSELTSIFDQTVTSKMNTRSGTYPNNLGHQASPGCFRCHDGAHYKVVKGRVTTRDHPVHLRDLPHRPPGLQDRRQRATRHPPGRPRRTRCGCSTTASWPAAPRPTPPPAVSATRPATARTATRAAPSRSATTRCSTTTRSRSPPPAARPPVPSATSRRTAPSATRTTCCPGRTPTSRPEGVDDDQHPPPRRGP